MSHALQVGRRRAIIGFSMSSVGFAALPIGLRAALAYRGDCSPDSALCRAVANFYVALPVALAAPFIVSGFVFGSTGVRRVRRVAWTAAPVVDRSTFGFVLHARF